MRQAPIVHNQQVEPLNKSEAASTALEYGWLQGQVYYEADQPLGTIQCVAVAPHDAINKWLFLHYYADCKDPLKALDFYNVPFYDVILVIESGFDGGLTYRNLGDYLRTHNRQHRHAG
jgi:hypothetical protein